MDMGRLIQRGAGQALPPRWFEHPLKIPWFWGILWLGDVGEGPKERWGCGGEATSRNDCVCQECAHTVPVELAKEQGEQAGIKDCSERVAVHSLFCDGPRPSTALGSTCCSFQRHQDIPWSRKYPGARWH